MILLSNQKGCSIIAAVFIIVIVAFMGVIFLTLFTSSSSSSINDLQSAQALYVAEGGAEYVFANKTFPNYNVATTPLGAGSFSVATPAQLTGAVAAGNTVIPVNSTTGFASPAGRIVIDSEVIAYTNIAGNTFNPAGPATATHTNGNAVYPVTRVAGVALGNNCTTADIRVDYTDKFLIPGIITIGNEYFNCTGTATGPTRFTGCTRCYKGSSAAAHAIAENVFQYIVTSTGAVGSAQRAVTRSSMQNISLGAMMVYAKLNGNGVPYYRRWDGTSWGAELTATAVPANIQYMVLKFARTRDEAVLGTLSSNGDIRVQVWDGAGWGATTLMGNTTAANSVYRGFDIEYGTSNDRAMVVYNRNVANQVSYRIWDGLAWTAQANQNLASASIGVPRWIEIARNPVSASSEIAMIVLGSTNVYVYGLRWTGAAWDNMGAAAVWDTAGTTSATKSIHVAYEQQTGRAIFIWGRSSGGGVGNGHQYYRIWNGATLTLSGSTDLYIAAMGGMANWVRLASDPFSNGIMYSVQDAGRDLNTRYWNGAAWDTAASHPEHDSGTEDASRNNDLVFETTAANAGMAWLLWGNGSRLSRRQWNGAGWGGIAITGDDTSFVQMVAHPVSGAVLSGIYESSASATRDIWESHLTSGSAVWSAKFTVWGGPTVAAPVMERLSIAAERRNNPLMLLDWNESIP